MMTRYEEETCIAISRSLPSIASSLSAVAKQLEIANKLKALELKVNNVCAPEMVDAALDGED